MGGGADDPSYDSFSSRWGIKGSSEVSEGLTAVYKFETRIGQGDTASQGTNQLYTGLSGGFGSLTLGKQSGAAYNHSGAIRDISNWHSHGDVGSRISNALSYSYSAESFSMQVAAVMDADTDSDGAVDQVEFGMTVGLGDIGKVAIGYEKVEDSTTVLAMKDNFTVHKEHEEADLMVADGSVKNIDNLFGRSVKTNDVVNIMAKLKDGYMFVDVIQDSTDATGEVTKKANGKYYSDACDAETTPDTCTTTKTYLVKVGSKVDGQMANNTSEHTEIANTSENEGVPTYTVQSSHADLLAAHTITSMSTTYGHKASHISASFGLAGITVALGHTTKDSNSPMMNDKEKTNFLGASGSIGDTGLSWNAWGRNVKNNGHKNGDDRSPWTVGLAKSLGGGATTFIEHTNADDGEDGTTSVALRVDF